MNIESSECGTKELFLTPKNLQSAQVQIRAVFVAFILKFQSVISAERTSSLTPKIYLRSLKGHGVDKIRLADLLKIHLGVEVDPQEKKNIPAFA